MGDLDHDAKADLVIGAPLADESGIPDGGGIYKVCRYFGDGGFASGGNYSAVTGPLANQNFLVIRAANACPDPPTVATAHQSLLYPGP